MTVETSAPSRLERDSMGEMSVPAEAYYGASTMRAVLNFPISDLRKPRAFIRALGQIKQAASRVNRDLGLVEPRVAGAIEQAAQEVIDGRLDDHFVLDGRRTARLCGHWSSSAAGARCRTLVPVGRPRAFRRRWSPRILPEGSASLGS